jgi:DNA invertase Pin-like site-specific DNA recombinase
MTTDEAIANQLDAGNLAAEPAVLTGARIGYARVSTSSQLLDRQLRALTEAGCLRVFADTQSGKTADRPELTACLDYLRPGDTLVVPSLDRLSCSLQDLIGLVAELRGRGVGFCSLHEALDTTTPGGRLVFHLFAALAEFIASSSSKAPAKASTPPAPAASSSAGPSIDPRAGPVCPRPARRPGNSVASIARLLQVSRSTLYKYVRELAGRRRPFVVEAARPAPALPSPTR